jgi:hypothetical protein
LVILPYDGGDRSTFPGEERAQRTNQWTGYSTGDSRQLRTILELDRDISFNLYLIIHFKVNFVIKLKKIAFGRL